MATRREKRVKGLIEQMQRERGYLPPSWPYAVESDPDFMEVYDKLYSEACNTGGVLPIKTKELIAIAIVAFRGLKEGLNPHMKRALRNGATKEEIFEALKVVMIFSGAPSMVMGVEALWEIEEEEKKG